MGTKSKGIVHPPARSAQVLTPSLATLNEDSGFPGGSVVKNPPADAGDARSIPGLGRFPGGGCDNPLEYTGLENFMDRGVQ